MLAYCQKIPHSLQECLEELCNDVDIVWAAISVNGLVLQYASACIQEDKSIIEAACESDSCALEFCPPGQVQSMLTADWDFMLKVLQNKGGPMMRLASHSLRSDKELLLTGLKNGMRFKLCPPHLQSDPYFLVKAVQQNASVCLEISPNPQLYPEIARAVLLFESANDKLYSKVLSLVPMLIQDHDAVLSLVKCASNETVINCLTRNTYFCSDNEIMETAITCFASIFHSFSPVDSETWCKKALFCQNTNMVCAARHVGIVKVVI